MFRLARDHRDRSARRTSRCRSPRPWAGEVDALMRPEAGVVPLALEVLQALEVGHPRRREIARRHDEVARADLLAAVGLDRPFAGLAVEQRRRDAGVELDVAAQVEAIGDVVDVVQDLRLGGVALGPLPFLLQLVGEGVGILQALDVAARAGIAVPEPGAADARIRPRRRGLSGPCRAGDGWHRGRPARRRRWRRRAGPRRRKGGQDRGRRRAWRVFPEGFLQCERRIFAVLSATVLCNR